MGTSIGQAIDYFISGTNAVTGTTLLQDLQAADPTAILVDAYPTQQSQSMLFIGRTDPENAQAPNGAQSPVTLGLGTRDEEYSIPCFISVVRQGPQQKPARDAALALLDVLNHWLAADPKLGGVLKNGRYAYLSTVSLVQTRDTEDAGDTGSLRQAWLTFDILARNHYTP
jgi:hypothetical protein